MSAASISGQRNSVPIGLLQQPQPGGDIQAPRVGRAIVPPDRVVVLDALDDARGSVLAMCKWLRTKLVYALPWRASTAAQS